MNEASTLALYDLRQEAHRIMRDLNMNEIGMDKALKALWSSILHHTGPSTALTIRR